MAEAAGGAAEADPPFRVGERFCREMRFEAEAIRAFATLVGDTNPLHHDEAVASCSRFGGLIASGAHSASLLTAAVAAFVTERRPSLGLETACWFRRAVPAGARLVAEWTIVAVEAKPSLGGHVVAFEGRAVDSDDMVYLVGQSKAVVLPSA